MSEPTYTLQQIREAIERALFEWGFEDRLDGADEVNCDLNAGQILDDILREVQGKPPE